MYKYIRSNSEDERFEAILAQVKRDYPRLNYYSCIDLARFYTYGIDIPEKLKTNASIELLMDIYTSIVDWDNPLNLDFKADVLDKCKTSKDLREIDRELKQVYKEIEDSEYAEERQDYINNSISVCESLIRFSITQYSFGWCA